MDADKPPKLKLNQSTPSKFQLQRNCILSYLRSYNDYLTKKGPCTTTDEALYSHQVKAVLELHDYFEEYGLREDSPQPKRLKSSVNPQKIALVVLPTGCGKSGVAVLASYALNAARVLVITPSKIISKQIREAYREFLFKRGIIDENGRQFCVPSNYLPAKSEKPDQMRESMLEVDLTITNAHKISDISKVKVQDIPPTLFDLVIVDEAHHYPAKTWQQLVDHFSNARKVFLTATPYYKGEYILKEPEIIEPCYQLSKASAVKNGIIRYVEFDEINEGNNEEEQFEVIIHAWI